MSKKTIEISTPIFTEQGVKVRINNKPYIYKFGEGYNLNRDLWESYFITFGKNKGRFLSKIRPFGKKEEECIQQ